jgi:hypothetical protein
MGGEHPPLSQLNIAVRRNPDVFLIVQDRTFQTIALIATTIAALAYRRPDQFLAPYLWVEEGSIIFKFYAQCGLSCAFWTPLNGFIEPISKVIALLSFRLGLLYAPSISAALAVVFTSVVVLCIAFCPTHLRARFWCAIAALVIPTGPENYAVGLYAFWWAGILILLTLLWKVEFQRWRIALLVIGGINSPIMVLMAPLFVFRAFIDRNRQEYVASAAAVVLAAIGVITFLRFPGPPAHAVAISDLPAIVGLFFGLFYAGAFASNPSSFWLGLILIVVVVWMIASRDRDRYFALLLVALMLSIASTAIRVPITIPHPFLAGARYFFYPYIILSWLLIWIAHDTGFARWIATFVLLFAFAQGLLSPNFYSRHDHVGWSAQLIACASSASPSDILIHYDGGPNLIWRVTLTQDQCTAMMHDSWF